MLQRTIGNQATLRYLRQRLSKLPKKALDQHRPLEAGTVTAGATPGVSDGYVPLQRTIGDGHDLSSPRFAGDLRLEACFDDEARLKQGDTGESVTKVQGALIELGYDLGPTGADGIYGQKTWNAVKAFKKTERLGWEHMGDVGPGTMGRLNELFPGGGNGHLPPCPRGTVLGGDQGADVIPTAPRLHLPNATCEIKDKPPGSTPPVPQPPGSMPPVGSTPPVPQPPTSTPPVGGGPPGGCTPAPPGSKLADPTPADLATLKGIECQQEGGFKVRGGLTLRPPRETIRPPEFAFNSHRDAIGQWWADPKLTQAADEGRAGAMFLKSGIQKTPCTEEDRSTRRTVDVHLVVSPAMSKLAQAGELEHVNDHRQAFEISLKEVERVLKTHVDGKRFGPKPTQEAVENLVRETIKKHLHPRLGKRILPAEWRIAYSELIGKSKQRDDKGWHDLQGSNRQRKSFGEVTYDLTRTSTTAICTTAPADLIKY